jgi:hypothetical protein
MRSFRPLVARARDWPPALRQRRQMHTITPLILLGHRQRFRQTRKENCDEAVRDTVTKTTEQAEEESSESSNPAPSDATADLSRGLGTS